MQSDNGGNMGFFKLLSLSKLRKSTFKLFNYFVLECRSQIIRQLKV